MTRLQRRISTQWQKYVYREEIKNKNEKDVRFLCTFVIRSMTLILKINSDEFFLEFFSWSAEIMLLRRWLSTKDSRLYVKGKELSRAAGNHEWHFAGVMAISGQTRGCAAFIRRSSRTIYRRWAIQMALFALVKLAYIYSQYCVSKQSSSC